MLQWRLFCFKRFPFYWRTVYLFSSGPSFENRFPAFVWANMNDISLIFISKNWSFPFVASSIYKFGLSVCLFVSNKRQNGWTDRAHIFCRISRDPKEGLGMIKVSKPCLHQNLILIKNPRHFFFKMSCLQMK